MNLRTLILVAAAALTLTACGSNDSTAGQPAANASSPAAVQVAYAPGTVKKGDTGYCVICVTNGEAKAEAVAETIDYEGKTYAFCNESEKAEFISNPGKYAAK